MIDHVSLHNSTGDNDSDCRPVRFRKNNAGKSDRTFWDVDSGSVRIGGIDVKDYKLDSLMKNISMVFQNVYLFPDTIENNIKFGSPNATHEDVVKGSKGSKVPRIYLSIAGGLPDGDRRKRRNHFRRREAEDFHCKSNYERRAHHYS